MLGVGLDISSWNAIPQEDRKSQGHGNIKSNTEPRLWHEKRRGSCSATLNLEGRAGGAWADS